MRKRHEIEVWGRSALADAVLESSSLGAFGGLRCLHGGQGHRADGAGQCQHRALPAGNGPTTAKRVNVAEAKSSRLKKIAGLRRQMQP